MPPRTQALDVGRTIRHYRESRGQSRAELAAAVGCSEQSISLYERGVRLPRVEVLARIAAALGVTLPELVKETAA